MSAAGDDTDPDAALKLRISHLERSLLNTRAWVSALLFHARVDSLEFKELERVQLRFMHELEQADAERRDALIKSDSAEGAVLRGDVDLEKMINDFYISLDPQDDTPDDAAE